ncbi:MAG: amidohydrolase family protein, partial [Bacteroidota bacterium]
MRSTILLISFFFLAVFYGCNPAEKADLVILNGKVVTINKDNPRAEALAVIGERIVAVGSSSRIEKYIDEKTTEVIDAEGRLVIPGFNDAHAHFGPVDPDYIELRYTSDPSVITEKV